jgi:hypothetical protein
MEGVDRRNALRFSALTPPTPIERRRSGVSVGIADEPKIVPTIGVLALTKETSAS